MKHKKTVTIGIPAHNEEKNIALLLQSILAQTGPNFVIEKIVIACDGCTDTTAKIVSEFAKKNKRIKLINDGKRLGQPQRLSGFYRQLKSDIFITFDGDITLGHNRVISALVHAFENKKVGLAGGYTIPYQQKTFFGKIVQTYEYFWRELIGTIPDEKNVQSHVGPISAGTKDFLASVTFPKGIVATDHFLFFEARKKGFAYRFVKNAFVNMHIPTNFNDYMKQQTRFLTSSATLGDYCGDWIADYYAIPIRKKLTAYYKTMTKYPLFLLLALLLNAAQRVLSFRYIQQYHNGIWVPVQSSK